MWRLAGLSADVELREVSHAGDFISRRFLGVRCLSSDVFWEKGPVIQQYLAVSLPSSFISLASSQAADVWVGLGGFMTPVLLSVS